MGAWVTGHNLAGYLPTADTYAHDSWDTAWRALRDEMESYADHDDESEWQVLPGDPDVARAHGYTVADNGEIDYGDDWPAMKAHVHAVWKDDGADRFPDADWSTSVTDGAGRSIEFWLMWSEDSDPEEEN